MTYWQAQSILDIAYKSCNGFYQPPSYSYWVDDVFQRSAHISNKSARAFIKHGWAELVKKNGKTFLNVTDLGMCVATGVMARSYKKSHSCYKAKIARSQSEVQV